MSNELTFHPDEQTLQCFLQGELGEADSREIESHIEQCTVCLDTLERVDGDDSLLDLARHGEQVGLATSSLPAQPPPTIAEYEIIEELSGIGAIDADHGAVRQM